MKMVPSAKSLVVFFLSVLVQNNVAEQIPVITNITQTQIKDIRDTVELSCTVQDTVDYPVMWMKMDPKSNVNGLPISTGSSLIVPESRYSLNYEPTNSTYTLQIKDLQKTDRGIYRCQILTSANNKVSADVELQVRYPPSILFNTSNLIYASEGEDVELKCYAKGYPPPWIKWRRRYRHAFQNGAYMYEGEILEIKNVTKKDEGTYYCTAFNDVGCSPSRSFTVTVRIAPVVTVPKAVFCQSLNDTVDLKCSVRADPRPVIAWFKDGVSLDNDDQNYIISDYAEDNDVKYSTVSINGIEQEQYGQYVCKATNKVGTAEGRVELIESTMPGVCP